MTLTRAGAALAVLGVIEAFDAESLVQSHVGPSAASVAQSFDSVIGHLLKDNKVQHLLSHGEEQSRSYIKDPERQSGMEQFAAAGNDALTDAGFERLSSGWKAFAAKAPGSGASPQSLLDHAKSALIQTGAMQEMRSIAHATMNASRSILGGQVPLDSMLVGFSTAMAPWNNLLKSFGLPLIKADFQLFTNFFGPEGNAARLCVGSSVQADSEFGSFRNHEVGGVHMFVGPAKWDNVPGWSFGASGGMDNIRYFDASDFGWRWTLAREPETMGFFYDMCLVDGDTMQKAALLETSSKTGKAAQLPVHGSSFLGHIWCSPDWKNTPLVIEQPAPGVNPSAMRKDQSALKSEEWDPEAEAV